MVILGPTATTCKLGPAATNWDLPQPGLLCASFEQTICFPYYYRYYYYQYYHYCFYAWNGSGPLALYSVRMIT